MSAQAEPKEWLMKWFGARRPGVSLVWDRDAGMDYFEADWIDSFAAVELVEDIEQAFRIRFTDTEMSDPSFGTMGGLARLVEERLRT